MAELKMKLEEVSLSARNSISVRYFIVSGSIMFLIYSKNK